MNGTTDVILIHIHITLTSTPSTYIHMDILIKCKPICNTSTYLHSSQSTSTTNRHHIPFTSWNLLRVNDIWCTQGHTRPIQKKMTNIYMKLDLYDVVINMYTYGTFIYIHFHTSVYVTWLQYNFKLNNHLHESYSVMHFKSH